jgi:hypothetical protein
MQLQVEIDTSQIEKGLQGVLNAMRDTTPIMRSKPKPKFRRVNASGK